MTALTVTAKHAGHYDDRHRRPGESFALRAREDFAPNWMEAVGWNPKAPAEPPAAPAPVPAAEPKPAKAPKAPATET